MHLLRIVQAFVIMTEAFSIIYQQGCHSCLLA